MRPLQISPETAVKLAEALQVPIERLMHMPQHILIQKLAELAQQQPGADSADGSGSGGKNGPAS
ncbi:YycC family protein [Paenibacillus flagellatus]|uniref:YycC family protein n=1 Tax=Paenibacillus flagellatus TaxID=2211139 RepID=A0A2V5JVZ2_9BACL|nr:YycC family protein [Paenibacillus flagellatus]PYI50818.1 YycC family protein [Paenibacillus flagellatus]